MTDLDYVMVHDWHSGCTPGSDGCGFMNCPRFCENTDRATCFGDFVVPEVDTSGYYTFVWYWIFNPGSPYISCYEAYIDAEAVTQDELASDVFDESPGSDTAGSVYRFQTQMPICVTGMDYNADQMDAFICSQFDSEVSCDDIEITGVSTDDNGFNLTAQIYHDTANADITSIAWAGATWEESQFCESMELIYSGSECTNCLDTITYALYTSGSVRNNVQIGLVIMVMAMLLLK